MARGLKTLRPAQNLKPKSPKNSPLFWGRRSGRMLIICTAQTFGTRTHGRKSVFGPQSCNFQERPFQENQMNRVERSLLVAFWKKPRIRRFFEQSYLELLARAAGKLPNREFDTLPEDVQCWVNSAVKSYNSGNRIKLPRKKSNLRNPFGICGISETGRKGSPRQILNPSTLDRASCLVGEAWTITDVAKLFRKTVLTIQNWRNFEGMPFVRIPGFGRDSIRFDPRKVARWAAKKGKEIFPPGPRP